MEYRKTGVGNWILWRGTCLGYVGVVMLVGACCGVPIPIITGVIFNIARMAYKATMMHRHRFQFVEGTLVIANKLLF